MAAIQAAAVTELYDNESEDRLVVYQLRGVDTGDTYDVAGNFYKAFSATALPASGSLSGAIAAAVSAGTTITFTLTSLADETVVLVVRGSKAV